MTMPDDTAAPAADAPAAPAADPLPLPLKAGETISFTPDSAKAREPAPVYYFRVPTISERAAFRRECTRRGCIAADPAMISLILRKGILECVPADRQADLSAVVDDWDAAVAVKGKVEPSELIQVFLKYQAITKDIFSLYPPFAQLQGDIAFADTMNGLVAVQMFLTGWDNVAGEIKRTRVHGGVQLVDEVSLDAIPRPAEWVEVQRKAFSLLTVGAQTIKN